jgi:hypothetical protein
MRGASTATSVRACLAVFVMGLLLMGACTPDRTMLVVRVDSDLAIPSAMDSVRVVVLHAGQPIQDLSFTLGPKGHALPLKVGLLSPSGDGADLEIDVTGSLDATFVVGQTAVTGFVKNRSVVLDIFLAAACVGFDCHDPAKTCTRGQECVDELRPPATLPAFVSTPPPYYAGVDGAAGDADGAADGFSGGGGSSSRGGRDGGGGAGAGGVSGVEAGVPDARADGPAGAETSACPGKVEDCFNGLDDDCDGLPDCADPDCAPTALCVPRPAGGDVGTTVGAGQTCPVGFAKVAMGTPYGLAVQGGGASCTGCQCGTSVTSCAAALTTYLTAVDCQGGTNGQSETTIDSASAATCPVPDPHTTNVYGAALAPWTLTSSACVPSGAPIKPTATFSTSTSFCKAANLVETGGIGQIGQIGQIGKTGCAAGSVCMRRPPAGDGACALLADASACPAGTKMNAVVYAGIQDSRACAACTCTLEGASCDNLVLQMGSDSSCGVDTADVHGGARACVASPTGVAVPGYHLAGAPTNGACKPASVLSGTLAPSGGHALCCVP